MRSLQVLGGGGGGVTGMGEGVFVTERLSRFRRPRLPACSGQRAPGRRTPSSRWLCRPSPAPAAAPACGRKRPCQSPVESGTRCPGCCRPAPPLADSPKSTTAHFSKDGQIFCHERELKVKEAYR